MISGLESAELKLKRAADHIKEINSQYLAYSARVLHEVVPNAKGKETVHVRELPPPEISIIAGEVLQQVRSSLDYLAFDLVKLNPSGVVLPANWEENCLFPLWINPPKKPAIFNCFKDRLPGISKPAFTFIESAQPYHRGNGLFAISNVLWFLAELSNIDKHRHLNLTPVNIGHMQMVTTKIGGGHMTYRTVRSGAELEPLPPDKMADAVNVERSFSSYITFDESVLGPGFSDLAVSLILETCIDTVKKFIIPAFTQFLKQP